MKRIINKLILLLVFVSPFSWAIKLDAIQNDFSQYLTRISPNDGLTQAHVTKIVQDKKGYMWFGTKMGLSRYDGYKIVNVPGPRGVIASEEIWELFVADDGYIWVSTNLSGLYRVDPKSLEAVQVLPGKNKETDRYQTVYKMIEQDNANFIIGLDNQVFNLSKKDMQLKLLMKLDSDDHIVRDMLIDGRFLFVASSEGVYRYDMLNHKTLRIQHSPDLSASQDMMNTKSLFLDDKRGLLVGTVKGLYSIKDYKSESPIKNELLWADRNIWKIETYEGQYLLATDQGAYTFDTNSLTPKLKAKYSNTLHQTSDNSVVSMFTDRQKMFGWGRAH